MFNTYSIYKDVSFILYFIVHYSFLPLGLYLYSCCWIGKSLFLPILLALYFQASVHVTDKGLRVFNLILPNTFVMSSTILVFCFGFAIIAQYPLIFDLFFPSVGCGRLICLHQLRLSHCWKSTNNLIGVPFNPSKHHCQSNFCKAQLFFITSLYDLWTLNYFLVQVPTDNVWNTYDMSHHIFSNFSHCFQTSHAPLI